MDFLSHVLARSGVYVLATFSADSKAPHHTFYDTVEQLQAAADARNASGKTVYHACATYHTKENRKASNAALMRSLWLDIDVGKTNDANSYDTLQEAVTALGTMLKTLGLPKPTIVSSGKGLHCYFTFDRDVTADEWKPLATAFSNALKAVGFKQDPSRTKDAASVLRPVGTHWRKGDEQLEVKLLNLGVDTPFEVLSGKLSQYADAPKMQIPAGASQFFEMSDDLGTIDYPPSSAYQVIKFCGAMKDAAESKGAITEPYWRGMLGIVKNCIEGEDLCHGWSNGDPRYNYNDTQKKIDGWTSGPTTCTYFSEHSPKCAECKFKDKIKSPIQLGIPEEETTKEVEVEVELPTETADEDVVVETYKLPPGFDWNGERLAMALPDKDGVVNLIPFCSQLVILVGRRREVDGTYSLKITRQVKEGQWREFYIPTAEASSKLSLVKALGAYEILTEGPKGDDRMQDYFKAAIKQLRESTGEDVVYNSLGWHDNFGVFVLGNQGVTKDGTVPTTISRGTTHIAEGDRQPSDVSGTSQSWAALVNELYNHKGAEAAQFTICAAFASPLIGMMRIPNWHGIPVGISGSSGTRKTSVCNVGLSVYGPYGAFTFQAGEGGTTEQARVAMFAKYKNVPILHDEITGIRGKEAGALMYAAANGRNKIRLGADGNITSQSTLRWDLNSYITAQTPIHDVLAEAKRAVQEATSLRCFTINADTDPGWKFPSNEAMLVELLSNHYGAVGREYLQFLTANHKEITARATRFVNKYAPDSIEENERYYRRLVATVMFASKIAAGLGFISFDLAAMQAWAEHNIVALRTTRAVAAYTPEEFLNELIGSLNGRTIVTKSIVDGRVANPESSSSDLRYGAPVARRTTEPSRPRLIVSRKYITDWARELDVDLGWFMTGIKKAGYVLSQEDLGKTCLTGEMFRLGVGTVHQTAPTRVIEFDCSKLTGHIELDKSGSNVIPLARQVTLSVTLFLPPDS